MYLLFAVPTIAVLLYFLLKAGHRNGSVIYSQPGRWFWLKYGLFYLLLKLRRRQKTGSTGYGVRSHATVAEMEKTQPLNGRWAVDAVFFNGCDANGNYVVTATARRHNLNTQTIVMIYIDGVGMFQLPEHPDTCVTGTPDCFAAANLELTPIEPMKEWTVKFEGELRNNGGELVKAKLDLVWTACTPYYDCDSDMSISATCRAIARQPWSRAFFERLRAAHQTHYEQFGDLKGKLGFQIGAKTEIRHLQLRGIRDHSYGDRRDWNDFHRYCIQYIHTEDGVCLGVGVVSMPATLSYLEFGFVSDSKTGLKNAVDWCDLDMQNLGEHSGPPNKFKFRLGVGGKVYSIEAAVKHRPFFYIGFPRDAKIFEQMCSFTVNGRKAWGFAEWQYNDLKMEAPDL